MAVNTSGQTMPRPANPMINRLVALMLDKFKMIPTHNLYRFNTLRTTPHRYFRRDNIRYYGSGTREESQKKRD
jgi:hypothetical protein